MILCPNEITEYSFSLISGFIMPKRSSSSEISSKPKRGGTTVDDAKQLASDKVLVVFIGSEGNYDSMWFCLSDLPDNLQHFVVTRLLWCKAGNVDQDDTFEGDDADYLRVELGYALGELKFEGVNKSDFVNEHDTDGWWAKNFDRVHKGAGKVPCHRETGATHADMHTIIISTWF